MKFEITGDNSNFLRSLEGAKNGVNQAAQSIEKSGLGIEDMFKRIAAAAGVAFSLGQMKSFVSSVMNMRGQFQKLEIAFSTMLGSEEKANALMSQLVNTAATTPFDLQGVANGAKQLLAYGTASEEVNETITRLGDIAAGLSIPLNDLVYLYGTTMTQGRMFTMDLRQFQGRGIPIADELAKQFGVAKNEVAGLVTAGKVGAAQVKQAIWDMTNEGSKFGGLMSKQSASITGQIANIEDAFDMMLNDIGKSSEGVINFGLGQVSNLVEHYKEIGSVLLGLVAAYGEYKAVLMATSALHNTLNKQTANIENTRQGELQEIYSTYSDDSDIMAIGQETATEEANTQGVIQNTASREGNVTAIDEQIAALQRKMLADIDEYDKIMESAQTALDAATKKEEAADSEIEVLQQQVDTAKEYLDMCNDDVDAAIKSGDAQEIETAKRNYNTAATELENSEKALATAQTNKETAASAKLTAGKNLETAANRKVATQEKLTNMQKAISTTQTKAQTTATGLWIAMMNGAKNALNSLKTALISNPFGAALAAITTIVSLLPMFSSETSKASEDIERFGESAVKQVNDLETLWAVVNSTNADSKVHKDAVEELCQIYEEYGFHIDTENDKLQQLVTMHGLVTDAIKKEGEERQKANLLESYNKALEESTKNMKDSLQNAYENAEWEGSGLFDDYDANEYQERAKELTAIIGGIIQSESSSLSTLTGNELEAKINEIHERINQAYLDAGLKLSDRILENGDWKETPVDVDVVQIMKDYAETTHSVVSGREALIKTFEKGKEAAKGETNEIDYAAASLSDLLALTTQTTDEVQNLGDTTASPMVDTASIQTANKFAESARVKIGFLDTMTAKPFIDTSSIDSAANSASFLLKLLNLVGNRSPKVLAKEEIEKRIKTANTKEKVDSLLKEINTALNTAEFGSAYYKRLEGYKAALEKKLPNNKKSSSGNKNSKDTVATETQKYEDLKKSLNEQRLEAAADLETKVAEARINAMEDGAEKVRLAQEQENKKEIDALEKQKKTAIEKYVEQERKLFEQQEKVKKAKNSSYKEQKFDEKSVDSSKISASYDELIILKQEEQQRKHQQEALESMRDFVKEYGSLEQQRLATTEEYDEKIAKATTEGEKLSLQKEKDQKIASLGYANIASSIDWKSLFSGVGTLSKDMMQPMMDKLMAYTKTDDYLKADSQTQKDVASLIQELRQYLGTDQSVTWESLATAMNNFMLSVDRYNKAVENERAAVGRYNQAKQDLKAGKITQQEFDAIKAEANSFGQVTTTCRDEMEGLATTLNDTSEQVGNFTSGITAALNNAKGWTGVEGFSGLTQAQGQIDGLVGTLNSVLPSMGDGMAKTIGAKMSSIMTTGMNTIGGGLSSALSSGIGSMVGIIAQIPKLILNIISSIKNFVTGIVDAIKEIVSLRWIDDLVVGILDSISGLIDAIFDLPENLWHVLKAIVVNGVGGLLNTVVGRLGNILSFGALSIGGPAEWFQNSNAQQVAESIDRLTTRNETLEQSIDDLTDVLKTAKGSKAIDAAQREYDLQQEVDSNYLQAAQQQASYHRSHHSWNYFWNKSGGFTEEEIARLSEQIGREWNGDIWDLSPEEMKMLRSNVDLWEKIRNTGEGDYGGRLQEQLNNYIDQAGKLEEITDTLNETLTTTSADTVFDDFLNSLYELAGGSEDVFDSIADSWQEMVNKMIINNIIGAKFQEQLKKWYEKLAELNKKYVAGDITTEAYHKELDALKAEYENDVKSAQGEIESMRNIGIINDTDSYSQEASSKGFESMGQDTAEELNGRFTALQISGDTIAQQAVQMYGQMLSMTAIQTSSNNSLLEIRNMMITANSYLEDTAKYSKKMYLEFGEKLDTMVTKTKNL